MLNFFNPFAKVIALLPKKRVQENLVSTQTTVKEKRQFVPDSKYAGVRLNRIPAHEVFSYRQSFWKDMF